MTANLVVRTAATINLLRPDPFLQHPTSRTAPPIHANNLREEFVPAADANLKNRKLQRAQRNGLSEIMVKIPRSSIPLRLDLTMRSPLQRGQVMISNLL